MTQGTPATRAGAPHADEQAVTQPARAGPGRTGLGRPGPQTLR
ncbi:hypothetical protein ACIQ6Y_14405 [Streptomyces sp. NPDC096205]